MPGKNNYQFWPLKFMKFRAKMGYQMVISGSFTVLLAAYFTPVSSHLHWYATNLYLHTAYNLLKSPYWLPDSKSKHFSVKVAYQTRFSDDWNDCYGWDGNHKMLIDALELSKQPL